tara:strand:+ start:980 stop:1111 length:132 start_codon:yes stop_codon:yes gene_type:complete
MGDEAGAIIQVAEFLSAPALLVHLVTGLHTLYITLLRVNVSFP